MINLNYFKYLTKLIKKSPDYNFDNLFDGNYNINKDSDRVLEQLRYLPPKNYDGTILFYDHLSTNIGAGPFYQSNCPYKNCLITNSIDRLNKSNYIIFSPNEMDDDTLDKLHTSRFDDQIWLLKLFENPENTDNLDKYNNLINFTSSYRWDSDIVVPYGKFITNDDMRYISHGYKYINKNVKKNDMIEEVKKKEARIAMFVSNCFTKNYRLNYTNQISKYYPVDVYGKCGDKTINRQDGYKLLKNKYKYYLAFENGNCQEYVTEKFFINALKNFVIPIVLGPSKKFYQKIAPKNSFIHIGDFKNAKDLSLYLRYLDDNPKEYLKYFEWIGGGKFIDTKFWCRLCIFAQNPKKKIYTDINKWWKGKKTCDNVKSQWQI